MPFKRHLSELFSPLTLAAIAAWLAVWFSMGGLWQRDPAAAGWAHGAAAGFLVLFIGEHLLSSRIGPRAFMAVCLALAVLALVPIALSPHSAAPILLVLWASLVATRYEGRALLLWLAAANLALALVMWAFWPARGFLWISWLAYLSFQAFAALVMRYAAQAERMSEHLRESNAQLAAVNAELLGARALLDAGARDSERLRISRELHDVAGHKLTALKLNLRALQRQPGFTDTPELQLAVGLSDELLQDIRAVVQQLRLHDAPALQDALCALAEPFPRPQLVLALDPQAGRLSRPESETVLRCVQEALTNAARHGDASRLDVRLQRDDGHWQLAIHDDGQAQPATQAGNGLNGMRERIEALGGQLQWSMTRGMPLSASWPAQE